MPRLFLSYRREDTAGYAGRLADALAARFGRSEIFRDVNSIRPGANFLERIEEAIGACDYFLLLIGHNWLKAATNTGARRLDDPDDVVRREIEAAMGRDVAIVPILVDGARMPTAAELPPPIAGLAFVHGLELSDKRWEYDLANVVATVSRKPGDRASLQLRQRLRPSKRGVRWSAAVLALGASLGGGYLVLYGDPEPTVDRDGAAGNKPPEAASTVTERGEYVYYRVPGNPGKRLGLKLCRELTPHNKCSDPFPFDDPNHVALPEPLDRLAIKFRAVNGKAGDHVSVHWADVKENRYVRAHTRWRLNGGTETLARTVRGGFPRRGVAMFLYYNEAIARPAPLLVGFE